MNNSPQKPLDVWTITHFVAGIGLTLVFRSLLVTLVLALVWELYELIFGGTLWMKCKLNNVIDVIAVFGGGVCVWLVSWEYVHFTKIFLDFQSILGISIFLVIGALLVARNLYITSG